MRRRYSSEVCGVCRRPERCASRRIFLRPRLGHRLDSERGIAWRAENSLGLRQFLRVGLDEKTPDQSTISRTR
jgi:hypothetical protein